MSGKPPCRPPQRIELFDFVETDERRQVHRHRINPDEQYLDKERRSGRVGPMRIEKGGVGLEGKMPRVYLFEDSTEHRAREAAARPEAALVPRTRNSVGNAITRGWDGTTGSLPRACRASVSTATAHSLRGG